MFDRESKILPREGVEAKPRIPGNDSLVSLSTLGEKQTIDFIILTDCPDMLQKSSRSSLIVVQLI